MQQRKYSSDLREQDWSLLEPLLPASNTIKYSPLSLLNGMFYSLHTDCGWTHLPDDFPHWRKVRYYFEKWQKDGTWQRLERRILAYYGRRIYCWHNAKTLKIPQSFPSSCSGLSLPSYFRQTNFSSAIR